MGLASLARSHHATLNTSQFYSMYGSQSMPTTVSTSPASLVSRMAAAPRSSVDQNRNSVLPPAAIKQEAEATDAGEPGSDVSLADGARGREADLLRNKMGSRGDEQGPGQGPMFSPLSATSRSPSGSRSDEEEGDSDEAERAPLKAPQPGANRRADGDVYMGEPALRQFYLAKLASLQAAQGVAVAADSGTPYLPAPPLGANSSEKISSSSSSQPGQDVAPYDAASDKEEESFRNGDSSYRDEDDADRYSSLHVAIEVDEVAEEEDEEEEEPDEEGKTLSLIHI